LEMPVATTSVAHAVSVWVVHSVADPARLFREVARVLRPGGSMSCPRPSGLRPTT
jgi:ubiquinone/menaquinone biosynthesis C-methylase UbiE